MKFLTKLILILAILVTVNSYAVTTYPVTPFQKQDVDRMMGDIKAKLIGQPDVTQMEFPPEFKGDLNQFYTVKTTQLSPGKVTSHTVNTNLAQPIFIIGDDSFSMDWLAKNLPKLKSLHATGVLVSCSGRASYDAIVAKTGLPIARLPGRVLAEVFDLKNYPVLITSRSIEQ